MDPQAVRDRRRVTAAALIRNLCSMLLILPLASCATAAVGQQTSTVTAVPPPPATNKSVYFVRRGDIVEEMQLSGRVAAVRQQDLSFDQAGDVAKIYVKATDPITKGQLLAELDHGDLLKQLTLAQLTLDQRKLELDYARQRREFAVQRAQLDLEEAQVRFRLAPTVADRELARVAIRRAQLDLAQARTPMEQNLEKALARAQLDFDEIKAQSDTGRLYAPADGVVAAVIVPPGTAVDAFKPIISVIDPHEREIRVENAPGVDFGRLSAQQPVTIRFNQYPDKPTKGIIERLPQAASATQPAAQGDTAMHISFDPGGLSLAIGDLAQVVVTLQHKENVLWLPPQAVRIFQDRHFVVVQDGDQQRRVDIKLGIANADRVEVVAGLQEHQQVISP